MSGDCTTHHLGLWKGENGWKPPSAVSATWKLAPICMVWFPSYIIYRESKSLIHWLWPLSVYLEQRVSRCSQEFWERLWGGWWVWALRLYRFYFVQTDFLVTDRRFLVCFQVWNLEFTFQKRNPFLTPTLPHIYRSKSVTCYLTWALNFLFGAAWTELLLANNHRASFFLSFLSSFFLSVSSSSSSSYLPPLFLP